MERLLSQSLVFAGHFKAPQIKHWEDVSLDKGSPTGFLSLGNNEITQLCLCLSVWDCSVLTHKRLKALTTIPN